jgi:hypothetical protein
MTIHSLCRCLKIGCLIGANGSSWAFFGRPSMVSSVPGCWSSDLPMFKLLQPRWSLLFHTSRVYPPTIIPNECWSNPRISQWFIPTSQAKSKLCWWHPPWICHPLSAHSLVIIPKNCHWLWVVLRSKEWPAHRSFSGERPMGCVAPLSCWSSVRPS